jgi:hypothetical protein
VNTDTQFQLISKPVAAFLCVALALFVRSPSAAGDKPASFDSLGAEYHRDVWPLIEQFCLDCHCTDQLEGDLDLEQFKTLADVQRETQVWLKVAEMLAAGEMPPADAELPTAEQRKKLQGWVERYLDAEALAHAGDPGPIVLRRLNNTEYRYTLRDLTGVDLDPAREFPTDSAAGEGFTNTGAALAMSPALLEKYLDAGQEIAAHAVLLPSGFRFSPQATRRDWTDEILEQIRGMYREFADIKDLGVGTEVGNANVHGDTRLGLAGCLPLEKYFAATLAHRDAMSTDAKTIETVAREHGVNAKYLKTLWSSLTNTHPSLLLDGLRERWRNAKPDDAMALAAEVAAWQKGLWTFGPVGLIGREGGPSRWMEPINPLLTQEEVRYQIPAQEDGTDGKERTDGNEVALLLVVTDAGDGNEHDFVVFSQPRLVAEGKPDLLLRDVEGTGLDPAMFGKLPNGAAIDAASLCVRAPSVIELRLPVELAAGREFVTTAELEPQTGLEGTVQVLLVVRNVHRAPAIRSGIFTSELTVDFSEVTQLFSDRRDVSYRGAILAGERSAARRRIELAMDEFRSLFPAALCFAQIVPVDEVLTLTLFYREDDHLARLMLDDDQQAQLDRLWEELHYVSQSAFLRVTAVDLLLEVVEGNEEDNRAQYNAVVPLRAPVAERAAAFKMELIDSEPRQVDALVNFAVGAYRRPLSDLEEEELRGLYRQLRQQDLRHDEAFRLTLARVFVAPPFLYRLESAPAGSTAAWVSDWELANRLSYFLWSSLPDEELRAAANAGRLTAGRDSRRVDDQANAELLRQTRRMLDHPRVRRLATEFACQYLHIHDFDLLDAKSEQQFPEFAELRGDMYEESILFFTNLFQNDGSLLSLLSADQTFVNERLARFYGIEEFEGTGWRRQEGMRQHGRGGILGLATTLAKQSSAARTSPILRGNWVSEVLLGEKLPRPPPDVPQLGDTAPEGLTERQLIEQHSSNAACSKCHARIDPFGFALEHFDAIGRRREKDAGGLPINARTTLPDGTEIEGLDGLRDYLLETRRDQFLRQFCRKLLGYALAREVQLSDRPLLDDIMKQLAENDYRFSVAVDKIVLSDQFRKKRAGGND